MGETFAGLDYDVGLEVVERLRPLVPPGATLGQLALRWILMFDPVTAAIPGARTPEQAQANAAAADLPPLSKDTMAASPRHLRRARPPAGASALVGALTHPSRVVPARLRAHPPAHPPDGAIKPIGTSAVVLTLRRYRVTHEGPGSRLQPPSAAVPPSVWRSRDRLGAPGGLSAPPHPPQAMSSRGTHSHLSQSARLNG